MTLFDPEMHAKAILTFIQLGYKVLSQRVLIFVTMLIGASLFGVAIYQQSLISMGAAALYCVLVFLPVLYKDKGEKVD